MFAHGTMGRQIVKALLAFVAFAIPATLSAMPEVANLTVGAVVFGALSWLETLVA